MLDRFERLLEKAEALLLVLRGDVEHAGLVEAKCELREVIQECRDAGKEPAQREPDQMSSGARHLSKPVEDEPEYVADEPEPVTRFRSDEEFIQTFRNSD